MAAQTWYCYYCGTQMTLLSDPAQLYGCVYCGARNFAPPANVTTSPNIGVMQHELYAMQQTHATSRKQ